MLLTNEYDPYTMIVKDDVFVFHDPNKIKKLFEMANIPYNELVELILWLNASKKSLMNLMKNNSPNGFVTLFFIETILIIMDFATTY